MKIILALLIAYLVVGAVLAYTSYPRYWRFLKAGDVSELRVSDAQRAAAIDARSRLMSAPLSENGKSAVIAAIGVAGLAAIVVAWPAFRD